MQKMNKLMFQAIFIFPDYILIKQIIAFSASFLLGEADFQKYSAWSFEWGTGAWIKMQRLSAFSGNVNTINWKKFSHTWWNIQVTKNSTSILEKDKPPKEFKSLMLPLFEKEEASEKGQLEMEDWHFSAHSVLWFQENSIYTLHLCFS